MQQQQNQLREGITQQRDEDAHEASKQHPWKENAQN
jgi:hypothetical protein